MTRKAVPYRRRPLLSVRERNGRNFDIFGLFRMLAADPMLVRCIGNFGGLFFLLAANDIESDKN